MQSIEDGEVTRLLTDVERARAALDAAYNELERAVARAVVDGGASWSEIGSRVRCEPQSTRRDFLQVVSLYRDTWPVFIGRGDVMPGDPLQAAATVGLIVAGVPDAELSA